MGHEEGSIRRWIKREIHRLRPWNDKENGILCCHLYVREHPLDLMLYSECIWTVARSPSEVGKVRK